MNEFVTKLNNLLKLVTTNTIIVEVTVPTGLEIVAKEELINLLNSRDEIFHITGRIYFHINVDLFDKILNLRSVDNVHIVADTIHSNFTLDPKAHPGELLEMASKINFSDAINKWTKICNFTGNFKPSKEDYNSAREKQKTILKLRRENEDGEINDEMNNEDLTHDIIKYRVSCDRKGTHFFASNDAERIVGDYICEKQNWVVDLKYWDLNIMMRILQNDTVILLKVTRQSLHRRKQLVAFGAMTLRPTIAYGMLALAKPKPGEHILDPLCGSGAIPIECMHAFPDVIISCGDISQRALDLSIVNINAQKDVPSKPNLFQWSASKLPFKDHSIDVIVSDLPFGKRSGNKGRNFQLYKDILSEFKRVLKIKTGRVVLLTKDDVHLFRAMDQQINWVHTDNRKVNVGALMCTLVCAKLK